MTPLATTPELPAAQPAGPPVPRTTRFVWALGCAAAWLFYRVERIGPPVPAGPLLLVANHANGLLDPALVVSTSGRLPRFLAKSTLFSGAPYSFLIRWSGALPVHRRQDAGADLAKNVEMFAAVQRALSGGDAVCLFPEGTSHSTGRLEPLKTGAARIVLGAEAEGTRVAIVGVGLNFTDKGVFRSPLVAAFGPAFSGHDLLDPAHPLAPGSVDALTDRIAAHLRDVLVEASPIDDAHLVALVEQYYASARALSPTPPDQLARRQAIARGLDVLRSDDPARLATLVEAVRRHDRRLSRFGLETASARREPRVSDAVRFLAREIPLALLLLPTAGAAAVTFAVPYFAVDALARRREVTHDIQATVKVMGGLVVYGAWLALLASLAGWWAGPVAALVAAIALPLVGIAGVFAIDRETSAFDAAQAWLALWRASPAARQRLRQGEQELAAVLDEAHAWVSGRQAAAGSDERGGKP